MLRMHSTNTFNSQKKEEQEWIDEEVANNLSLVRHRQSFVAYDFFHDFRL